MNIFNGIVAFAWDQGNQDKNWKSHKVRSEEAEEAFFDRRRVVRKAPLRTLTEERQILIGKTRKGRLLWIVFTIRNRKIRVISARDTNRTEEPYYEQAA